MWTRLSFLEWLIMKSERINMIDEAAARLDIEAASPRLLMAPLNARHTFIMPTSAFGAWQLHKVVEQCYG